LVKQKSLNAGLSFMLAVLILPCMDCLFGARTTVLYVFLMYVSHEDVSVTAILYAGMHTPWEYTHAGWIESPCSFVSEGLAAHVVLRA
jgi:hypothetical protein